MKVIQDDLWICTTCLIPVVNGDLSGLSDDEAKEVEMGMNSLPEHFVPDFDSETGEGIVAFSDSYTCECCGTSLAGEWHRFAVLGEVGGEDSDDKWPDIPAEEVSP